MKRRLLASWMAAAVALTSIPVNPLPVYAGEGMEDLILMDEEIPPSGALEEEPGNASVPGSEGASGGNTPSGSVGEGVLIGNGLIEDLDFEEVPLTPGLEPESQWESESETECESETETAADSKLETVFDPEAEEQMSQETEVSQEFETQPEGQGQTLGEGETEVVLDFESETEPSQEILLDTETEGLGEDPLSLESESESEDPLISEPALMMLSAKDQEPLSAEEILAQAVELSAGGQYQASWGPGERVYYQFTPTQETAGEYVFYTTDRISDTAILWYQKTENGLESLSGGDERINAVLSCNLEAGVTYVFEVKNPSLAESSAGGCQVHFRQPSSVASLEVASIKAQYRVDEVWDGLVGIQEDGVGLKVVYGDGSSDTVSRWGWTNVSMNETPVTLLSGSTSQGKSIYGRLEQNGQVVDLPAEGEGLGIRPGSYTLRLYHTETDIWEYDPETAIEAEAEFQITETQEGTFGTAYSLPYGEAVAFSYTAPKTGEYVLKNTGSNPAQLKIYEKRDGAYFLQTEHWGGNISSVSLEEGKSYSLVYCNRASRETALDAKVEIFAKKRLQQIRVEKVSCGIFDFQKLREDFPVTLVYTDGSEETIRQWEHDWQYNEEDGSNRILGFRQTTAWEDTIQIGFFKDGQQLELFESDEIAPAPGTYELRASLKDYSNQEAGEGAGSIALTLDPAGSLNGGESVSAEYALGDADSCVVALDPARTGLYSLRVDPGNTGIYAQMYKREPDSQKYVRDPDFGINELEGYPAEWPGRIFQTGSSYCLVLSRKNEGENASGTVTFEKQQEAQALVIEGADQAGIATSAFNLRAQLFSLTVKVLYDNGEAESVAEWSYGYQYQFGCDVLSGRTESGYEVFLTVKKGETYVDIPWSGDFLIYGDYTLAAVSELIRDSQTGAYVPAKSAQLPISSTLGNEETVTVGEEKPFSLIPGGEGKAFRVELPEEGTYVISQSSAEGSDNLAGNLYWMNPESGRLEKCDGGYSDASYRVASGINNSYYLYLWDRYQDSMDELQGTVSLSAYKEAESYDIGMGQTCQALLLENRMWNLPVTISYGEGEEPELIDHWEVTTAELDLGEEGSDWGEALWSRTSVGDDMVLFLWNKERAKLVSPYSYYDYQEQEIPLGAYSLILQVNGEIKKRQDFTLQMSRAGEAIPLEPEGTYSGEIGGRGSLIYSFAPDETMAGSYNFFARSAGEHDFYGSQYTWDPQGQTLIRRGFLESDFSGSLLTSLASGYEYYYVLSNLQDAPGSVSVNFDYQAEVTGVRILSWPERTQYIEGLGIQVEQWGEIREDFWSPRGLEVQLSYSNGKTELLTWDRDTYEYDSNGNGLEAVLYKMVDGEPDWQQEHFSEEFLAAGTYALSVRPTFGDFGIQEWTPITVQTRAEAAAGNPFRDEKAAFENPDGYYAGALYTAGETGRLAFVSDGELNQVKLYERETGEELSVSMEGGFGFSAALEKGKSYEILVDPREAGDFSISRSTAVKLNTVTLLSNGEKEFLSGIDTFDAGGWRVQAVYENSQETITLSGNEKDQYGNAFRYEVREKETGRIVSEDASWDTLEPGTYLVTAVHRTIEEIRSENSVEVTYGKADVSSLPKVAADQDFTVAKNNKYQLFAFTPEKTGYYELEDETKNTFWFYEQTSSSLQMVNSYLIQGTTYVLAVQHSPKEQTARIHGLVSSKLPGQGETIELPGGEDRLYEYSPEETGQYVIRVKDSQGLCKAGKIFLQIFTAGGSELMYNSISQEDGYAIGCDLTAGESYQIKVSNAADQTAQCGLSVQKAPKATDFTILPKDFEASVPAIFIGLVPASQVFEIQFTYEDGSTQTIAPETMDSYGNRVDWNWEILEDQVEYTVYFHEEDIERTYRMKLSQMDVAQAPALKAGVPAEGQVNEFGCQYYHFVPETSGEYMIQVTGEKGYYQTDLGVVATNEVNDWSGVQYLKKGQLYGISIRTWNQIPENFTVEVRRRKTVESLTLLTPPEPVFSELTGEPKGMTLKVQYTDGTTGVIAASDYQDPYGNQILVEQRRLPDGRSRYIAVCGGRSAFGDVRGLTVEELPKISEETDLEAALKKQNGNRVIASFVPKKDGFYRIKTDFQGQIGLSKAGDETLSWLKEFPAYLNAGERYVVYIDFVDAGEQTVHLRMELLSEGQEHQHTPGDWETVKEPTCAVSGSRVQKCTGCGTVVKEETIPATGIHSPGAWETVKEPTCTVAGSRVQKCTGCGTVVKEETIPATGIHSPGAWETIKQPTCAVSGSRVQKCTVCGALLGQEPIPATGKHAFGAWKVTKEATALAAGVNTRACTVCGKKETKSIAKLKATMKLNVTNITLKLKQSTTKVTVTGLARGDKVKSWKSSNTKIVKVDNKGKITAQNKTGKATLTVTLASGKTGKVTVTVQKSTVKTAKIGGLKSKVTVAKGKTLALKPVLTPITSTDKITYTSSNKKVATVTSKGVIKGVKAGTAAITVKAGTKKFTVRVTVPKTKTVSITNLKKSYTLNKGKTLTLKPKRNPSNSDEGITYASSNKKVATVTSKGVVKALRAGTAVITVKSGSKKVTVKITVPKTKTKSLTGLKSSYTLKMGKTLTLKPGKNPSNSEEGITYVSSNKKIATVTSKGIIKGVKKGTVYITVRSGEVSKKVKIVVK